MIAGNNGMQPTKKAEEGVPSDILSALQPPGCPEDIQRTQKEVLQ